MYIIYICLLLLSLKMYSLYNYRHFYCLQIVTFRFWKTSSITLRSFHSNNLEEKIIEFIHKVFFNYLSIRNWWELIVLEATFLCQCQGQEFIAVTTRRLVEGHRCTTFFCHGLHFFLSRFLNLTLVFTVPFPTSSLIWNVLLVFTLTLQIYFSFLWIWNFPFPVVFKFKLTINYVVYTSVVFSASSDFLLVSVTHSKLNFSASVLHF